MSKELKDISQYLHLYLGCRCRFKGQELKGKINQENLWVMFSVTKMNYGLKCNLFAHGVVRSVPADETYPILRPLSSMRESEEREFKKLIKDTLHTYEGTRYLLSKHFDLFGLIEYGLAIDATQTPQP